MPGPFQPTVPLNRAIFNACYSLAQMAGTELPDINVDPIWQIQKKGCAAIQVLTAAGIPNIAVFNAAIAALTAALAAETAARIAADLSLLGSISAETAARIAADALLQAQITACCAEAGVLTWMNL